MIYLFFVGEKKLVVGGLFVVQEKVSAGCTISIRFAISVRCAVSGANF